MTWCSVRRGCAWIPRAAVEQVPDGIATLHYPSGGQLRVRGSLGGCARRLSRRCRRSPISSSRSNRWTARSTAATPLPTAGTARPTRISRPAGIHRVGPSQHRGHRRSVAPRDGPQRTRGSTTGERFTFDYDRGHGHTAAGECCAEKLGPSSQSAEGSRAGGGVVAGRAECASACPPSYSGCLLTAASADCAN